MNPPQSYFPSQLLLVLLLLHGLPAVVLGRLLGKPILGLALELEWPRTPLLH